MSTVLGIDLGGTKIEAAFVDSEQPEKAIARMRVPTESEGGYEHILGQIEKLCRLIVSETGLPMPSRIGLGTPGVPDPTTQCIKNSNTQCINGQPLGVDLGKRLGAEFVLANDANCFALAEATLGCARGYETVFGIIMGTGVGGGLVVNGKILSGRHGIAGEWGQVILNPNGPTSVYGTRGTVEAHIAGQALEKYYASISGRQTSLKEIARLAKTGDTKAQATIGYLMRNFAKSLAIIVDVFDPHAIVLGGGVGNIDALYSKETHALIERAIFNPTFEAALLKPTLGDSAGVFGAAMLVR